jgi:hypothetical protein
LESVASAGGIGMIVITIASGRSRKLRWGWRSCERRAGQAVTSDVLAPELCPVLVTCTPGAGVAELLQTLLANACDQKAWDFLRRYIADVDAFVFSCKQFAPSWIPGNRLFVIAPSIDPFSAKNEPISGPDVGRSLQHVGLLAGGTGQSPPTFSRRDGSVGRVSRPVDLLGTGPPPPADVPIVLQASRWDALKDMPGVMTGFAESLAEMGTAQPG